MIVVTGATGQLGGLTLQNLLAQRPASELAVSVRSPEKVADLAARGVRVRAGDYTDADSLVSSFEGGRVLFLVSASVFGDEAVRQHARVIEAAQRAGIERIVYTSHQCASPTSAFVPARDHAATEELLAGSGLAWTSLRDGFHAASVRFWLDQAQDGVLRLPEDGPISWTTHEDLAAGAALSLLADQPVDGPTPPLTGGEALDAAEVAALASEVTGVAYRREVVGDDEFLAGLVSHGVPSAMAEGLLSMFWASRAGEFDVVDPTLASMLGRDPRSLRDLLSAAAPTG
jgi:NAD(P)H dehydrogenase (quinone)